MGDGGKAPAGATHIHVKDEGDRQRLYHLIDLVEQWRDDAEQKLEAVEQRIAESKDQTSADHATLLEIQHSLEERIAHETEVRERLDNMDKNQARSQKHYEPIAPDPTTRTREIREQVARFVLDVQSFKLTGRARFDSAFARAVTDGQIEETASLGGYLVPEEHRAAIIAIVERYGVARRVALVLPMASDTMQLPTGNALPAVYWDTEITNQELTAPTKSTTTLGRKTLNAHKLIGVTDVSIELQEDSVPLVSEFILDRFAIAISKEEDTQYLTSDGSGNEPFTGILNVSGIGTVTAETGDNTYEAVLTKTGALGGYAKLLSVMNAADEDTAENGMWIYSNSILNAIRKVTDGNSTPLWAQMAGGPPGTLFGRPYVLSRVMPKTSDGSQASTAFLVFGDFKFHIFGDRRQLSVDVSEHAAFREFGLVWRVVERVAMINSLTEPFAVLKTAA